MCNLGGDPTHTARIKAAASFVALLQEIGARLIANNQKWDEKVELMKDAGAPVDEHGMLEEGISDAELETIEEIGDFLTEEVQDVMDELDELDFIPISGVALMHHNLN
tara:strand:+ start:591 stop:914 length:324 start_codon:yes stop_codon:yes gene_type:complete